MRFLTLVVSLVAMLAVNLISVEAQTSSMIVSPPTVDANGVKSYPVWSTYQGEQQQTIRVLEPTAPAAGQRRRLLYVLPVVAGVTDLFSQWSDGLEELRLLDVPNRFNMTLIAPSFNYEPWYGDNVLDSTMLMESFIVKDLVPWGDTFAPGTQRLLIGFSKSGNGALTLIFRNPNEFTATAAWDSPAQLNDLSAFPGLSLNFGTQANFNSYYIPSLVMSSASAFQTQNRLWISGDQAFWTADMIKLNDQLTAASIPHTWVAGGIRNHSWGSGWLDGAATALDAYPAAMPPVRTNGQPTSLLPAGISQTSLSLTTDENATCSYATTAGVAYGSMPNKFSSTGGTTHSTVVSGLLDGSTYIYYVRCQDANGGVNPDDFIITFSVATANGTGNIISSAFSGSEDPLSENGMWDTPGAWNSMKKNDGAYSANNTSAARLANSTVGADQYAEITYDQDPGSSSWVGVTTRVQGKTNGSDYLAIAFAGQVRFYRTDDSGSLNFTFLASTNASVGTAPRRLRLESQGSTHRIYVNGALALSYTDGTYTSGEVGIAAFGGPSVKILSFIGGALAGVPVRTNGQPTGVLTSGTTQTNLSLTTNENASCRYATTAGVAYGSMPNRFSSTGEITHFTVVTGLVDGGTYNYYVRCQDTIGNANQDDFVISFSVRSGPRVSSVTLSPTSVIGGNLSSGIVTLNSPAPSAGAAVVLSSSDSTIATVPASITVPANATSATFTVTTSPVATSSSVVVSASYASSTGAGSLNVIAATLSSVSLSPPSVRGGTSSGGTVTLNGPAPAAGAQIALASNNPSVASVPTSITIAANATSATFSVSTSPVATNTPVSITALYASVAKAATLTVTAATLTSVRVNPTSVRGGTSSSGTVTLNGPAPANGALVTLSTSNSSVATVPASVTVASGATTAMFLIGTTPVASNTSVTISGVYGSVARHATLAITAATLSSVVLSPRSVLGTSSSMGTVTLNGPAPAAGALVTLSSANTGVATVPNGVIIGPGATTATFNVATAAVAAKTSVTIAATYGTITRTASLIVSAAVLTPVTVSPPSVKSGTQATGTVTLNGPAPQLGATVSLSSSNTTFATVSSTVTVPANTLSASFAITTTPVTATRSVAISAKYGGGTKKAILTITP